MPIGVYARKNNILKNLHTKKKKKQKEKKTLGVSDMYI